MVPAGEREKEALKKATDSLDEGAKALATRQKHIQLVDPLEYSWSTVKYYEADLLASNSDDEKCIKKAEKEAQREIAKRWPQGRRKAHPTAAIDAGGLAHTRATSLGQVTDGILGRCQQHHPHKPGQGCSGPVSGLGLLVIWQLPAQPRRNYPFYQPVVSSAELVGWFNSNTCVNKVNDMSAEHLEGVNGSMISSSNSVKRESQPVTPGIPDGSGSSTGELEGVTEGMDMLTDLNRGDLTKFWEIESNNPDQITNVHFV